MTANLTPAEARAHNAAVEAAARVVETMLHRDENGQNTYRDDQLTWPCEMAMEQFRPDAAAAIRALSVPIPPEPDVEAVVNVAAGPLLHSRMPNVALHDARAVVAALTAAGMLRLP